ncbi:MAG: hypothetical protein NTY33_00650 [Candidatus Moranbacteria bacterium]|nr:hypothetical protein [Candidatus Moranbacteria bacterium]
MRKTEFANGEYYHIYNRGVDKREVFSCDTDYIRFLKSIKEFNVDRAIGSLKDLQALRARSADGLLEPVNRVVDIVCYCLNPKP